MSFASLTVSCAAGSHALLAIDDRRHSAALAGGAAGLGHVRERELYNACSLLQVCSQLGAVVALVCSSCVE
jgi:hypothetical protein